MSNEKVAEKGDISNMIEIFDNAGNLKTEVSPLSGSIRRYQLMGDDYVTLKFTVAKPLYIALGDYVDTEFGRFVIVDEQRPSINSSTGGYDYELKFEAIYRTWKNKVAMLVYKKSATDGTLKKYRKEATWNLTADITTQAGAAIIDNLECLGYTYLGTPYSIDLVNVEEETATKSVLVSYDNTSIYDALTSIANAFSVEWWIDGSVIYFGKNQYGESDRIELAYGKNVCDMGNAKSSADYANRFYVFGSTNNLKNYRRSDRSESVVLGVVTDRLMLPKTIGDHIDLYKYNVKGERVYITDSHYNDATNTEMPTDEVVETTTVFEDVYPKMEAEVDSMQFGGYFAYEDNDGNKQRITLYNYHVKGFFFDRKYLLEGQTLQIKPQTGLLAGMTFDVIFNALNNAVYNPDGSENPESQWWQLVINEDYGRRLPDDTLKMAVGDKVVFVNFNADLVNVHMVPDAEQKLYDTAVEYIKKQAVDNQTYDCKIMCDVAHEGFRLGLGQCVSLVNDAFFSTPRLSRVIGYEIPLDIPYDNPTYTIGEAVSYSTIGSLSKSVEELTAKGQIRDSQGSGIHLIRTYDTVTPASDTNAYSALRSLRQFVNAVDDDDVDGLLSFAKGLQSVGFQEGIFGTGFELARDRNGHSYMEVDEIYVRMRAVFVALGIKHVSHVGGEFVLSPAGIECSRVEMAPASGGLSASDVADLLDADGKLLTCLDADTQVYRCNFKTSDGDRTIYNQFAVGDLALCREFNTAKGADGTTTLGRSYWRAVVNVGDDFIDLSVDDCQQGSDVPQRGDTIVSLGNKTDKDRQNAIVISSYGAGSPSIKMYQGIKTYVLSDENAPIIISPNGNRFTGDFVSSSGVSLIALINGRAKVYTEIPQGKPYKVSDLWTNATIGGYKNELLRCVKDAEPLKRDVFGNVVEYQFRIADWIPSNGYSSEIKQTADSIRLSVYELGMPSRNYATLPKSYKTTMKSESLADKSIYQRIGYVVTDGLSEGQKVYLSGAVSAHVDKLLAQANCTLYIFNGKTEIFKAAFKAGKGDDITTAWQDEELTVDERWLTTEALDIVLYTQTKPGPSVTISDFRVCLVKGATFAESQQSVLYRTGIDIVNKKISLQADTTEFVSNDGTKRINFFTSEGKIAVDAIDADSIVAKRVEAVNGLGRIVIDEGAVTMTDKDGNARLRISGNNLTEALADVNLGLKDVHKSLNVDGEHWYAEDITDLPADDGYSFAVQRGAVVKFPSFSMYAGLGVAEPIPQSTLRVVFQLLLDGKNIVANGKVIGYYDSSASGEQATLNVEGTTPSFTMALAEGTHTFSVMARFYGGDNNLSSATYSVSPKGDIVVTYPTDIVEIAANGFRAATKGGTYIQQTAEACVMAFQRYQLKVSANGIQVTVDGGNNWKNLV